MYAVLSTIAELDSISFPTSEKPWFWLGPVQLLMVREDYEEPWSDEFFMPLRKMLDDMVEEAAPRAFSDDEIRADSANSAPTPVALLNLAWHTFEANQAGYRSWERSAIASFLERH